MFYNKAGLFCCFFCLFLSFAHAQDEDRIESEFKLSVLTEEADDLWNYLQQTYGPKNIRKLDPFLSAKVSEEIFYDTYFDTYSDRIATQKAGVRHRQRYIKDSLVKELVQVKLPTNDESGVARKEIKFNLYKKNNREGRMAMHPFWKLIRPKDRDKMKLQLNQLEVKGDELNPEVKVEQLRKRIYVSEDDWPYLTMTLDRVRSFYFPYPEFYELELELNEIRYTEGDEEEREEMEAFNAELKSKIMNRFPSLRQDQTPKYNKMKNLISGNVLALFYDNYLYVILLGLVTFAGTLWWKNG